MKKSIYSLLLSTLFFVSLVCSEDFEQRELVTFPEKMQKHMMSNMRNHLQTLNFILISMANDELDQAADSAEKNLGMSSLKLHHASHMAKFMPKKMQQLGTNMHKAASRFALKAQEGEAKPAYAALTEITAACVACHASYRVK